MKFYGNFENFDLNLIRIVLIINEKLILFFGEVTLLFLKELETEIKSNMSSG
jgi:hypothetical protein